MSLLIPVIWKWDVGSSPRFRSVAVSSTATLRLRNACEKAERVCYWNFRQMRSARWHHRMAEMAEARIEPRDEQSQQGCLAHFN